MADYKLVGKHAQAEDGLDKVTGKARFVADYQIPGALHARVLRSPLPHARILSLDVSPALRVPGVIAAITAEDFVNHGLWGWPKKDAYMLAWQKVRYVGDPVAAVAAETEEAALKGIQAILVQYEELPVVSDMHHALDPDAPIIPAIEPDASNLTNTHLVRYGNPDPILEKCALIQEGTYTFQPQEHAYLETEAALAIPEPDGGLTVYANDQSPFINRDNLAMVLGMPIEKVRVIQAHVGGSFGGKDDIGYQCSGQVGALALKTKRPVRLVLGRTESMIASYKREAMEIHIKLGASLDGQLKAARVNILADSGAYSSQTPLSSWRASVHGAGAYRYQAVHVDTQSVYTNNGYGGAFRGFGNTEAVGAIEQAVDELAFKLNMDPIDLRLKNCLGSGDLTMTGDRLRQDVHLAECLTWVREHSDWDRKRTALPDTAGDLRRGIGVACYFHGSSLGGEGADYATITLKIEEDGSITLTAGLTDFGQGSRTVYMIIAAEALGVDPKRIRILRPDTQTAIESGPTVASRATMLGGNAARVAAGRLNLLLTWAAANALHCQPAQIHRVDGMFIGPDENPLSFDDAVKHAREMGLSMYTQGKWEMPHLEWDFEKGTGRPYHCYTFGAQIAEVETNLTTGKIRVTGVWAAHDGGRIIYTNGAYGQMYGGITQGLGYALTENLTYVNGYPQSINLADYHIPNAKEVPPIDCTFIQYDHPDGPYGALNLAEPVMLATAPAIANAVFHAVGKRTRAIPIRLTEKVAPVKYTPEDYWRKLGLK